MREFLPEPIKTVFVESTLEESARVDAGGRVALDVDLVATTLVLWATEEVVETDLVQRCTRRVGGNVATYTDARALSPVHHDRRIPANVRPNTAFYPLVSGEPRLSLGWDRVDVVGGSKRRDADVPLAGPLQEAEHEIPSAIRTLGVYDVIKRITPLGRLFWVDIDQLRG
jgi:hypothetical protein